MKRLYEVNIYARAEENSSAKWYRIPVRALNDKMAIMNACAHLSLMGMVVVDVNPLVPQYDSNSLQWAV